MINIFRPQYIFINLKETQAGSVSFPIIELIERHNSSGNHSLEVIAVAFWGSCYAFTYVQKITNISKFLTLTHN